MERETRYKLKALRHQRAQYRAEMKKRSSSSRRRRRRHVIARNIDKKTLQEIANSAYVTQEAPKEFSFVDNTDALVSYLNDCERVLHKNKKVIIDISKIDTLSTDAIALLVACVNDNGFSGKYGQIRGNAPVKKDLANLFIESGFYRYVETDNRNLKHIEKTDENLLNKESHIKVQADLAKKACLLGTQYVFKNSNPLSILYEMLIEAMSNTNNHANKGERGKTKWWLYVYNAPDNKTCYSFVDLGVGIFDSMPVAIYKKVARKLNITHNADLVMDLLDGKIKSREKVDQNIRGKGIPQIARNSENDKIGRAYIISNDVKINLKTRSSERLKDNFKGTFLYWELVKPQNS